MCTWTCCSDNLCFTGERTLMVDWNLACRGNGLFDIAAWLPSLQSEGGPVPEEVSEEASVFAGIVSGYFAARAGEPIIVEAPRVRGVRMEQLRTALPWAVRASGLPPVYKARWEAVSERVTRSYAGHSTSILCHSEERERRRIWRRGSPRVSYRWPDPNLPRFFATAQNDISI